MKLLKDLRESSANKETLRRKIPFKSPNNTKERMFNNSLLQRKMDSKFNQNRKQINKFMADNSPKRNLKRLDKRKHSLASSNEEDDDMNLQKYLFRRTKKKGFLNSFSSK